MLSSFEYSNRNRSGTTVDGRAQFNKSLNPLSVELCYTRRLLVEENSSADFRLKITMMPFDDDSRRQKIQRKIPVGISMFHEKSRNTKKHFPEKRLKNCREN